MFLKRNLNDRLRNLALRDFNLSSFFVIDIRSKQAFLGTHIKNSIYLQSEWEIAEFLRYTLSNKSILCCFL